MQARSRAASRPANRAKKRPRRRHSQVIKSFLGHPTVVHYLPAWMLLAAVAVILLPNALSFTGRVVINSADAVAGAAPRVVTAGADAAEAALDAVSGAVVDAAGSTSRTARAVPGVVAGLFTSEPAAKSAIASLFRPEVAYWSEDISRWAQTYGIEANLLATVMQIESCGHPTVASYAGAQGLFQVMPFHFRRGERQLDPETNARRGAGVLSDCLTQANGDVGLALACYNGGPGVLSTPGYLWDQQVRDYYAWGTGIYADALANQSRSATLERWLEAGGSHLCRQAAGTLGIE